jgi:hypothetical protein
MKIIDRWQRSCAVGLGLLLLAAASQAQTNPLQKGPDPTSAILNANAGPFAIASTSVPSSVSGFGGGTVYYPTTAGSRPSRSAPASRPRNRRSRGRPATGPARFRRPDDEHELTFDQPSSRATQLMYAAPSHQQQQQHRARPRRANRFGVQDIRWAAAAR